MKIYDVVVFEEYEKDGENKSRGFTVGTAFESKDGKSYNGVLAPGVSLSGRFTVTPRREKTDAP